MTGGRDARGDEAQAGARAIAELYRRFGQEVFELSLAHQRYEGARQTRPLTDAEIGERLGLSVEQVRYLRCRAEVERLEPRWFREADTFKKRRGAR